MTIKELIKVSQTLKLLYVEDDETARESTLELLVNFFTDIIVAVDGEDGLEKFHENDINIIISDINMPKISGITMIEEIKKTDDKVPVMFLSAHNESSFLSDGIKLGVDGYILKPLSSKAFTMALSKVCEKINLQRENENYTHKLEIEVKKQTLELHTKLHFDELTGLHNRYSFFEDIKSETTPAALIVDINKFNIINEIYGTDTGSVVLQKFASFLLDFAANTSYKLYRVAGDEFVLKENEEQKSHSEYEKDILKILRNLKTFSVKIDNTVISIEVTIGLSIGNSDVFESAKIALDCAKKHKKDYEVYSVEIDSRNAEHDALKWKEKTKLAIDDNRIVPVYQPIVDKNAKTVKHETLMRLRELDSDKLISPFFFLSVAIKTGLYNTMSSHIIFEGLHLLDSSEHTLSFNFTYQDIKNLSFLNEIESFLITSPGLGNRAVFEITEDESIENYEDVKRFIKRFRAHGVKFAVDDFGSGFSNFEYILEIEPDYLKIDGSLVKNIDTDAKAHILVSAIVEFSHKLGIKVIAEYVHSKTIFEMLHKLDVDEYQGFYFSEPIENI